MSKRTDAAFGRAELFITAATFVIVVAILVPNFARTNCRVRLSGCNTHLKQISLAMILWSEEHGTNYPMHVALTNGGSKELTLAGHIAPVFRTISNELQNPRVLVCPADKERPLPTNFHSITDDQVSYFVALNAALSRPDSVLVGDRHLATNQIPLRGGVARIDDLRSVGWTKQIHDGGGNVALADGSAHMVTSKGLQTLLEASGPVATFVMPAGPAPSEHKRSFPIGVIYFGVPVLITIFLFVRFSRRRPHRP